MSDQRRFTEDVIDDILLNGTTVARQEEMPDSPLVKELLETIREVGEAIESSTEQSKKEYHISGWKFKADKYPDHEEDNHLDFSTTIVYDGNPCELMISPKTNFGKEPDEKYFVVIKNGRTSQRGSHITDMHFISWVEKNIDASPFSRPTFNEDSDMYGDIRFDVNYQGRLAIRGQFSEGYGTKIVSGLNTMARVEKLYQNELNRLGDQRTKDAIQLGLTLKTE